jgi:SsrA-binding protein
MDYYAENKKARFDYEILETFEAGLILTGSEVKSVRKGSANLKGGFINFHNNSVLLSNVHIPKYKFAGNEENYDPERSRKLLLKVKEISYLRGKMLEKGLTIVPLSLYNKGRHIKLSIGLAKGKKKYDKRESIKKRDTERETRRTLKGDL